MNRLSLVAVVLTILGTWGSASAQTGVARRIAGLKPGPTTTVLVEPLNEWGYPDYAAALNQELGTGVAAEENFWTAFDAILPVGTFMDEFATGLRRHRGFEQVLDEKPRFVNIWQSDDDEARLRLREELDKARSAPWKSEDFPDVAMRLDSNKAPLQAVLAAAARPKAYSPLVGRSLIDMPLPHVQAVGDIVKALAARAMQSLGMGRGQERLC